jgi:hypothetical protein
MCYGPRRRQVQRELFLFSTGLQCHAAVCRVLAESERANIRVFNCLHKGAGKEADSRSKLNCQYTLPR